LNQPFKPPAAGERAVIPFGMPNTVRPGNFLLPPRLDRRKSASTCYAGRHTEDISATFASSLPLPIPLRSVDIEKPAFSFHASFKLEGRTLQMHREFISRVAGQVCPPEMEAEIAADMNAVRINVNSAYSFRQPVPQPLELTRVMAADQRLRLDFLFSLNPDCSSIGYATVRLIEEPKHGKITIENGTGFSNFRRDNSRFECNKSRSDGVVIFYEPEPGFVGADSIAINAIYASGTAPKRHYTVTVE